MKIAILTEIINRQSGARAPLEIAKALAAQGEIITIFGYHFDLEKEALAELKQNGVKVVIIRQKKWLAPIFLAQKLKKGDFNLINFHGTLPTFLGARLSGIPIVRTYHGTQLDSMLEKNFPNKPNQFSRLTNYLINRFVCLREKLILSLSDQTLAISQYTQKELKRLYCLQAPVVYEGASPTTFRRTRRKKKKEVLILSVSRIVPYKGFHRLIKVFNRLNQDFPHLRLRIIGGSFQPNYLNYLSQMANKNVKIQIKVPDKQLIEAYRQADIYASFDRYLFFGMPVLEAATFGIPAVVYKKCAAGEAIDHGRTGFLAKNEKEFTFYLKKFIVNQKLRNQLGRQAATKAQLFSWPKLAEHYRQVFKTVIEQKKL